jgi:hypothetical protein
MTDAGLRRAAITFAAAVASFLVLAALSAACGATPQPGIVAAILAIGLMRRPKRIRGLDVLWIPLTMVAIALGAAGMGWMFHTNLIAGGVVFTAILAGSMWLRKFTGRWRRVGELLAMPLVVMLVVPPPGHARGGPLVDLGLVVAAGLVPLVIAAVLSRFVEPGFDLERGRTARAGMAPTTRMAAQLAVALSAAFALGFMFFPEHWGWVVLTAFLVSSGSLGREHAIYFGFLRLLGAVAGTVAAAGIAHFVVLHGPPEAVAIFAMLFLGIWLRDVSYAYWAACITVILALLSPASDGSQIALLGVRLIAIFVGAVCAVLAAWFVYPIRTHDILRLRLAELLLAIDGIAGHTASDAVDLAVKRAEVDHRLKEFERVVPPVQWHRRLVARGGDPHHPAGWACVARSISAQSRNLPLPADEAAARTTTIRRAIGLTRLSIANHGKAEPDERAIPVSDALEKLHRSIGPPSAT